MVMVFHRKREGRGVPIRWRRGIWRIIVGTELFQKIKNRQSGHFESVKIFEKWDIFVQFQFKLRNVMISKRPRNMKVKLKVLKFWVFFRKIINRQMEFREYINIQYFEIFRLNYYELKKFYSKPNQNASKQPGQKSQKRLENLAKSSNIFISNWNILVKWRAGPARKKPGPEKLRPVRPFLSGIWEFWEKVSFFFQVSTFHT